MCGITGFVGPGSSDELIQCCTRMTSTLNHRGPDDMGVWCDERVGVALGHARLSIVDLSPLGHQPMVSKDGRWVIVYNGEVYNFQELRRELEGEGAAFRGRSDTEVILEGVAAWGVERTIQRLIGMFAVALWNREERRLYLVRDRLGIKPLYWGRFGDLFLFGSELKALRAHPNFLAEIDRTALTGFLRYSYVPAPYSIYNNVFKLPQGHILQWSPGEEPVHHSYWDLREIALQGQQADREQMSDREAVESLDQLLRDAVQRRMVADVPLGALLSGGIDSSLVVALMQAQSDRPVKSFSIGFHEKEYDEAQHAKAVAAHLGTDHTELYVESGHTLDVLPQMARWYDEPFADSSQIPTYLVSELTRNHVTVALSGDGGDELFGGYTRYFWANTIWNFNRRIPRPLRRVMGGMMRLPPPEFWKGVFAMAPSRFRFSHPADKMYKLAGMFPLRDADSVYRHLISDWQDPESVVIGSSEPMTPVWDEGLMGEMDDFTSRMQYMDTVTYLPDDILTKVDRASMAVSLEARVPLLDHRVVEFAWNQPLQRKIRNGQGKWLLRQVLYHYVPKELIERPKMGFGVPIDSWLRGPLREWAESLLDERRLRSEGYFRPEPIIRRWREHLSGRRNWQYQLWGVLMFQSWLEHTGADQ